MNDSQSGTPRTDVAQLLNLTGTATQLLVALFAVTQIALFASTSYVVKNPWVSGIALILVIGATVASTRPGPYPLTPSRTYLTVAAVAASTALVSWQLPTSGWPGYASWHLGANTFLLLGISLRGRSGWAWIGMTIMFALTLLWTVTTGQGVLAGVGLVDRQAGTLLIGTIFAIGLSRTARRISEFSQAEAARAGEIAAIQSSTDERNRQARYLHDTVLPVLTLIASPQHLTVAQREEFLIIEASLRDSIRARSLYQEPLIAATVEARRRGVDVLLLDDSQLHDRNSNERLRISAWVADHLRGLSHGAFTARVLPLGRPTAASIVVVEDQGTRHFELTVDRDMNKVIGTSA